MAQLIRQHDWATTSPGPVERWLGSLRTLVDLMLGSGEVMCLLWGRDAVMIYNDAYARSIGERHPAALGRSAHEVWADVREGWAPLFERAWTGEEARTRDRHLRFAAPDVPRQEAWFDLTYTPVRNEAGEVQGILATVRDVTDQVQAEQNRRTTEARLRESEAGYRELSEQLARSQRLQSAMLEVVPVGLALLSTDGGVILSNPAWDRFTPGRRIPSRDPDRGWRWQAWDTEGHAVEPHNYPGARALRGEPCLPGIEFLYTDDGGDQIWTNVASVPLLDTQGQVAGAVSIIMDIDAAKRAEQIMRASEERHVFLLGLGDALRAQTSPQDMIEVAARLLGEHLGASRIMFAEFDEARGVADIFHGWFADGAQPFPEVMRLEDYEGPILDDLRAGRTVRIEDTRDPALARPDLTAIAELGVAALLSIPLIVGGRLAVNLSVHQHVARHWTDADVALAQEVAERLWADLVRARVEAALRESEKKYRRLFETMSEGFTVMEAVRDEVGRVVDVIFLAANQAWERQAGVAFVPGTRASELFVGSVSQEWIKTWSHVADTGEAHREEQYVASTDRWYETHYWRVAGNGGNVLAALFDDITVRKRAEAALRESEERLRAFGEASSDVLWIRDAETLDWTYLSPAFECIYGLSREEALHGDTMHNWLDMIVPHDRERARAEIEKARQGERVTFEYRITRPSDGEIRLLRNTDFPIHDAAGHVTRIGGVGHDATEEQATAERLQVLVHELQHRTRNLMGVVQSITNKTLAGSTSLEDFQNRIRDRLEALARVNGLLSRLNEGDRITFDELIRTELKGHGVIDGHDHGLQVNLQGPKGLRLRSSQVQTLALGLHELATNALKYGALSQPDGRLDISWHLVPGPDDKPQLRVDWRESGVEVAMPDGTAGEGTIDGRPPRRRGYGRELIEQALPYQLGAETSYELTPEGARCTITLPLSST
ncbi:PAS domain S-box protein [Paracoccus chinensis]|nr:PAS domain S-box protein [Paracoccus chinensis]